MLAGPVAAPEVVAWEANRPLVGRFGRGAGARAAGARGRGGRWPVLEPRDGAGMGGGGNDPWRGVRASRGGTMAGDPRGGVDRRARAERARGRGGRVEVHVELERALWWSVSLLLLNISESSNATSKLSPEGGP